MNTDDFETRHDDGTVTFNHGEFKVTTYRPAAMPNRSLCLGCSVKCELSIATKGMAFITDCRDYKKDETSESM